MSTDTGQRRPGPVPRGVYPAGDPPATWSSSRISKYAAGAGGRRAAAARAVALRLECSEVSGSLGDLGTFLPHIVGAITVVRMDPTGILTTFGLFYALSGAFYGVPMAVQPMKAASAAVLIEPMNPGAIAGAGLVYRSFFPSHRRDRNREPDRTRVAFDDRRRAAARPWAVTRRARHSADGRATLAWRGDLGRHARADAIQADARGAYRCGRRYRGRPASWYCAAAPAIGFRTTSSRT